MIWQPLKRKEGGKTGGKIVRGKTICLIVIKAFKDIQAVPETHALCTHDLNGINIELSLGLITAASSIHDISNSYACAQVLSSMFVKVSQSPGQSLFSSNNRCNTCSNSCHNANNVPQQINEDCCLPPGYHCDTKTDQTKECDLTLSNISSQDENWNLL